jgi:hypothetical protein
MEVESILLVKTGYKLKASHQKRGLATSLLEDKGYARRE